MIDPSALVAISVSAPSADELGELGLSELHLRYVFTELVRHVLAAGGAVAYGGRLDDPGSDQPNFTRIMLDMAAGYRPDLRPDDDRLVNFVAGAFWDPSEEAKRSEFDALVAGYEGRFQVERCATSPRHGVPTDAEHLRDALSFTSMREQMADQCTARVVLGGRLTGYGGRYPGVVEEAILTARAERALYVAGGFGGGGRALATHLRGKRVAELTQAWQTEHTPSVASTAAALTDSDYRLDLDAELADALPRKDWATLHNGLTAAENDRLATTTDPDEVVALVMSGLHRVAPRPRRGRSAR